ncbi:MAG: NAD-dependent epimerase/dehydratase family protein [Alphaproteobacteria bacterium]
MKVLVTGGAGFIGSQTVDTLLAAGHDIIVLDVLDPQVHGHCNGKPANLAGPLGRGDIRFVAGSVEDRELVATLARDCDTIVHLAAAVGVGQSGYQPYAYTASNALGTASVLDAIATGRTKVERLVVASSISNYGEGAGYNPRRAAIVAPERNAADLAQGRWEPCDPADGLPTVPVPTPETHPIKPQSIYGLTKAFTEDAALRTGIDHDLTVVALRFANTYGPRQALSNPYTGVVANFCSRLLAGKRPIVFEDGQQRRDFLHVRDAAQAIVLALTKPLAGSTVVNVGTGGSWSLLDLIQIIDKKLATGLSPQILARARAGDVRHFFPDTARARALLGFTPSVDLAQGIEDVLVQVASQPVIERGDQALAELEKAGFLSGPEAATPARQPTPRRAHS